MECKICKNGFHNCPSCCTDESDPEYHGFCSDKCMEIDFIQEVVPSLQNIITILGVENLKYLLTVIDNVYMYESKIVEYIKLQ